MRIRLSALATAGLVLFSHSLRADTLQEDFATNPAARGWRVIGQTNLFSWNSTDQDLEVTWDSSATNSFFWRPLGTILAADDDFTLAFDLTLSDVAIGVNPDKPNTFELAVGLLNSSEATRTNFFRGAGTDTPDFVEFDYFPDSGFGPSLDATLSDTNSTFEFYWVNLGLTPGASYRVSISYWASNRLVEATVTQNNGFFAALTNSYLSPAFRDFRLDRVAVCSYSDAGQDPQYAGSLLAHGVIDNISLTLPPPPVADFAGGFTNGAWQVQFVSRTNWLYTLERTLDFQTWTAIAGPVAGNGANLLLEDAQPPEARAFYRVKAARP